MTKLAAYVVPLQTRFVRPLADAAQHSDWVPASLGHALRRVDGTCAVHARPNGGPTNGGSRAPTVKHPIIARLYAGQATKADELGMAQRRRRLVAGLSGRVLEIGAGTGASFAHFPATVTEVVALEPEPFLRGRAQQAAAGAPVRVRVLDSPAESTPFEDAEFDAALASLVLCSVSDPARALRELYRVLRPGGELRFNEHVRSRSQPVARVQRTADRLGWPRVSGGCHLARDTEASIRAAGFEITSLERYRFRVAPLDPPKAHIIGVARKPAVSSGCDH
jgi:SAM-dependent methyltransferase